MNNCFACQNGIHYFYAGARKVDKCVCCGVAREELVLLEET